MFSMADSLASKIFRVSDDWIPLFITWLDVISICLLDIAVCSHNDRQLWLNSLAIVDAVAIYEHRHDHSSLRWMISRRIRMKKITICASKVDEIIGDTFLGLVPTWITHIDFSNCTNLSISYMRNIIWSHCLSYGTSLQTVILSYCEGISDVVISALAQSCPQLHSLNIEGCNEITNDSASVLSQCCPYLHEINLAKCSKISDVGLVMLCEGRSILSNINLQECGDVTDIGIIALARNCPKLSIINLENCRQLTDLSLLALGKCCPYLKYINICVCMNVTDRGLVAFIQTQMLRYFR